MSSNNTPSSKALNLLLEFEVGGGQKYYEKYLSKFTWPGGASGPTIAIGVDCGYYTKTELKRIFNFLPHEQVEQIQEASQKTGEVGKEYAKKLRESGIVVTWEKAVQIFQDFTWPKFTKLAENTFPGLKELHPDAYGSIVSLVFNRGTSLKGDSRKEMVNIKKLIPSKNYKQIAQEIRNMKRLWANKNLDGLLRRREAEASLIESVV